MWGSLRLAPITWQWRPRSSHEVLSGQAILCFALNSHVVRNSVESLMHFLQVNTELQSMVSELLLQSNYSELQAWTVMSSTVNFNLRLLGQQPCSQSTSTLFLCVLVGMQDCGTYETTIVLVPWKYTFFFLQFFFEKYCKHTNSWLDPSQEHFTKVKELKEEVSYRDSTAVETLQL